MFTANLQAIGAPSGLARRVRDEQGFSLIELLVVCLMIAVLCAIAIPQFITQSAKASDTSAKELLHSAQVAAESIATANDGSYENVTATELNSTERGLPIEEGNSHAWVSGTTHSQKEYSITATATDGVELTLARRASGGVTRTCHSAKKGCSGGETGSW